MIVQDSERPIKDSAQSMENSDKKSLPMSSGSGGNVSGGLRSSSGNQRSSSGGIRGIMENLSRSQDVTGQVGVCCPLSSQCASNATNRSRISALLMSDMPRHCSCAHTPVMPCEVFMPLLGAFSGTLCTNVLYAL